MGKLLAMLVAALVLTMGPTFAADSSKKEPSPAQKAHRECMSTCSKDAKEQGLKGDERKAFMRQCPSSGAATASQQDNGKRSEAAACRNEARAKGLKGDERKTFMSECVGT